MTIPGMRMIMEITVRTVEGPLTLKKDGNMIFRIEPMIKNGNVSSPILSPLPTSTFSFIFFFSPPIFSIFKCSIDHTIMEINRAFLPWVLVMWIFSLCSRICVVSSLTFRHKHDQAALTASINSTFFSSSSLRTSRTNGLLLSSVHLSEWDRSSQIRTSLCPCNRHSRASCHGASS